MANNSFINKILDDSTVDTFSSINNDIKKLNNSSIATFAKLFNMQGIPCNPEAQRSYFMNILIPSLYSNDKLIKDSILNLIDIIDIIDAQIAPKEFPSLKIISNSIYPIQLKNTNEKKSKEFDININSKSKNKVFLQLIPDGLLLIPDFQILENGKQIDKKQLLFNSYLPLNDSGKINLTFLKAPQNLFFLNVLTYKSKTIIELSNYFRQKFHIPHSISNYKAELLHDDHTIKLTEFVSFVQKSNQLVCPICHCNDLTEFGFVNYTNTTENILDFIIDDDEKKLKKAIKNFKDDHVFYCKNKVPLILNDGPSFISLCSFFKSTKCFNFLMDFYLKHDKKNLINIKDGKNRSPIHFACFGGNLLIIKELINNGEELNFADSDGFMPVHYASMNDSCEVIKYLYTMDVDMFSSDNSELKSPLHIASQFGSFDIVKFYIKHIIPNSSMVDFKEFVYSFCKNQITPFHISCKYDQLKIMKLFLTEKRIAQISFDSPESPLVLACQYGNLAIVKTLLKKKKIFNITDQQIIKAFNTAVFQGQLNIVMFFTKKICNIIPENKKRANNIQKDTFNIKVNLNTILTALLNNTDLAKYLFKNISFEIKSKNSIIKFLHHTLINEYEDICTEEEESNVDESSRDLFEGYESGGDFFEEYELNGGESEGDLSEGDLSEGDVSEGDLSEGDVSEGDLSEGDVSEGDLSEGDVLKGDASEGDLSKGDVSEGDISKGDVSEGDVSKGDVSKGDVLEGDAANGRESMNVFSRRLPVPIISRREENAFVPRQFIPSPFITQPRQNQIAQQHQNQTTQQQQNNMPLGTVHIPGTDPSVIGYDEHHAIGGPVTFDDLSKFVFSDKLKVMIAVQNISMIEKKSVHIVKSESRRIEYRCINECNFKMTWKENNGMWSVPDGCFKDHICTYLNAKVPTFHSSVIDCAIKTFSLSSAGKDTALTILSNFFGSKVPKRNLKRRLDAMQINPMSNDFSWKSIPSYLKNNILNGGLSDLRITTMNEIHSFAMLPHYAKLLLSSQAILPVIIIDGTFQSSVYRGTMIIVMIVSSNRTNIPIGWAWGPSEDEETITLILGLVKEVNDKIETVISDEGTALKSAVSKVFPKANHKLCAWHISKNIANKQVREIFWFLIRADHPIIFQALISKLFEESNDFPQLLKNGKMGMFARFFEGIKENGIITSSPCESINADIRSLKNKMPLSIFHFLETIGFNRCLDLLDLQTEMTPYYTKRKQHLNIKAQRLQIVKEESFGTSRTIVDTLYQKKGIRWEVNTRNYQCECGKYTDRGYPCAHLVKAFQDLNEPYEKCVHPCYFTATIRNALKDLRSPVSLSVLEQDESLFPPPAQTRICRTKRYLFGFERSSNNE